VTRLLSTSVRFLIARRLAFPALLVAINLGCSAASFNGGDWKRGVYWICSAMCIAMMSL